MNKKHLSNILPKLMLGTAIAAGLGLPIAGSFSAIHVVRAADDLPDVPHEAEVKEESSKGASFTAPNKGQVWLYDVTAKEVVHSISVWPNNVYAFDVSKDLVTINGQHGPKMDLSPKHTYRIFYLDYSKKDVPAAEKEAFSIPKSAKHVADGKGVNLSFTADEAGTIYLFDRTNGDLINVFRVHKADVFVVEPKHDRVAQNDKIILKDLKLKTDVDYRLYFVARAAS